MPDDTVTAPVSRKGYYRLSPQVRGVVANLSAAAATVAGIVALFDTPRLEGVWLRLPAICSLLAANGAAWYVFRRRALTTSPVVRGGLLVALAGTSLVAAAMQNASGWAGVAGLLGLLSAAALRGSVARAQIKGRDLRTTARKPVSALFDQVESLASALVVVLLVWHFALEAFRIPSGSMAPTLSGDPVWGDRVFVDKMAYEFRDPQRWEPVVFRYPLRRSDPYVKRLIGLPGEDLLIAQGDIYIRRNEGSPIELLTKPQPARDVLWLPLLRELAGTKDWVSSFQRDGEVDFKDGAILVGKGGAAVFPKGSGTTPGNVTDHDASFGGTETPRENFGRNVCGDFRARLRVRLDAESELGLTIVRDGDRYRLTLKAGAGGCSLVHESSANAQQRLLVGALAGLEVPTGSNVDVQFGLADGVLSIVLHGSEFHENVGSPLLSALRSRDKQKRLELSGDDAVKLATAEPAEGRQARFEIRGGAAGGGTVVVKGIERDVYYVGRVLPEAGAARELPFGVKLEGDHYFVLGDNSPGSKDARAWIRAIIRMKDGTQVIGGLDDAGQDLAQLLAGAGRGEGLSALQKFQRVALLKPFERADPATDGELVAQAMAQLRSHARQEGRGAVSFYTEGGGQARLALSEIETIQVQLVPYVERRLFVGRPFAVFLSPRGVKLIN